MYITTSQAKWTISFFTVNFINAKVQPSVLVVGGVQDRQRSAKAVTFDSVNSRWNEVCPMLTKRNLFAAATLNGKVIVTGGYSETDTTLQSAEEYDPITNKWTPLPDMHIARAYHALVSIGSDVLALGGCDKNWQTLKSVEQYKAGQQQWDSVKELQVARSQPAACYFKVSCQISRLL